jgi:hypothetical protein
VPVSDEEDEDSEDSEDNVLESESSGDELVASIANVSVKGRELECFVNPGSKTFHVKRGCYNAFDRVTNTAGLQRCKRCG